MLELMILSNLMLGPCHGYEFKKIFGNIKLNNNTLYPLLRKIANAGYVTRTNVFQESKPSKIVYNITDAGKERLYELISEYDEKKALNSDEFYLRVAFFQFLSKEEIAKILDIRESVIKSMTNMERVLNFLNDFPDNSDDLLLLHKYINVQGEAEIKLIQELRKKYGIESGE